MRVIKTITEDGLWLSGLLFEPDQKSDTVIIHIHGMGGDPYSNPFLSPMFSGYPQSGIALLSVETRGTHSVTQFNTDTGGVRMVGNAYENFDDSKLDIAAWVRAAEELGYSHVWLQGHSLGCSKAVYYAVHEHSAHVAGLVLISPSDMLGWNLAADMIVEHTALLAEAEALMSEGRGGQLLSCLVDNEYPMSASAYVSLFRHTANDAIFNFGNPELGYNMLHQVIVPVLAFTGTRDAGITSSAEPYAAMQVLERELVNAPRKRTVVFDGAKHNFDGFGEQIVQEVVTFISN